MQPKVEVKQPVATKPMPRQRHYLAVFFLSFLWGAFGVDRMYLGKWGTGILKLFTLGGFGVWAFVDIILVLGGVMRDKQGREMLQFAEYKKFSYMTILVFALVLGAIVLLNGIALIVVATELINMVQSGNSGIPMLDGLLNGSMFSAPIPEELQEYL